MTTQRIPVLLAVGLLVCRGSAAGLDPAAAMSQLSHAAWGEKDGLPQNTVIALAQTRDGYLWLGTEEGLVRFDGVRFAVFDRKNTPALKQDYISALCAARDGGLWIGTRGGGLVRYRQGRFGAPGEEGTVSHPAVRSLWEDAQGRLWIGTNSGLDLLSGGRTSHFGDKQGLPKGNVLALAEDQHGRVWAGTSNGLAVFRDGKFERVDQPGRGLGFAIRSLWSGRAGDLWIGTEGGGLYRYASGAFQHYGPGQGLTSAMVRVVREDGDGSLWVGTDGGGLLRLRAGRLVTYRHPDRDTGGIVRAILEDRERSLWIGTEGSGLHRLSNARVLTYTTRDGLSHNYIRAIVQDRQGAVWIGTEGGGLSRWKDGGFSRLTTKQGLLSDYVASLCVDGDGLLWIGTEDGGVNLYRGGRILALPIASQIGADSVWAMCAARDGTMWLGTENGLHAWNRGQLRTFRTKDGLPSNDIQAVFEDRDGNVWVGTREGGVARISGGRVSAFGPAHGLPSARVASFYQDRDDAVWAATGAGLWRARSGQFRLLTTRDGLYHDRLYQIVEDGRRRLWLTSSRGIFHVSLGELEEVAAGRRTRVVSVPITTADGMPTNECSGDAHPAGCRTGDGRLWFPTVSGLVVVDPARLSPQPPPPNVLIEHVRVDQQVMDLSGSPRLTPEARDFLFAYTAPSLLAPEKVRFRYRLEGVDPDWVEAGPRREAHYTHLPAGSYRFRVVASSQEGVWGEEGAAFQFELPPWFYQRPWFYVACGVLVLALALAAYRLHVRRIRREFAAVLAERGRVAREIHDTLLQGFAGTALELNVISETIPAAPERARAHLERVLLQVDDCLSEARRSIRALRSPSLEAQDLVRALREATGKLVEGTGIRCQVDVFGSMRRLPENVEGNLLRIAQEAVANSVRYARASEIRIELRFESKQVHLRVQDNGSGFDAAAIPQGSGEHVGVVGMRERAETLGGRFQLHSAPGQGTEVVVGIPV